MLASGLRNANPAREQRLCTLRGEISWKRGNFLLFRHFCTYLYFEKPDKEQANLSVPRAESTNSVRFR